MTRLTAPSRPPVLQLTEAALAQAHTLLEKAPDATHGLRVSIEKGGCAGMSYKMAYVETPDSLDEIVEIDDVRLYIAPADILFLLGARMDYQVDNFAARFVFENPNQTDACGCGESVTLKPAESVEHSA